MEALIADDDALVPDRHGRDLAAWAFLAAIMPLGYAWASVGGRALSWAFLAYLACSAALCLRCVLREDFLGYPPRLGTAYLHLTAVADVVAALAVVASLR